MKYREYKMIAFLVVLITILSTGIQINIYKNSYDKGKNNESTTYFIKLSFGTSNPKKSTKN